VIVARQRTAFFAGGAAGSGTGPVMVA